MPSIPDDFIPLRPAAFQAPAMEADDPGALDTLRAAGVTQNWVYRAYRWQQNRTDATVDPDHNPFEMIKGTKYESDPERFAHSRNATETQAIMREWDEDDDAVDTLSRSGWTGTVAGLGMGLLDPTIFIPIAKVFSGAAQGARALRIGADVAVAGAASAAIGEGVMYGTTPGYTAGDVATGVGTATLLSGLLGTGAGALLSRSERKALETTFHADREVWGAANSPLPQSAGAAASDSRQLKMRSVPLLNKLPDITSKLSPPRRVLNSPFVSARRAVADLVETPYLFDENVEGIATTQGPALNRIVLMETGKARVAVSQSLDQLYGQYRFGNANAGRAQRMISSARDLAGRASDGKVSFVEFKSMIDDALRAGDTHEIAEVAEGARMIRKTVLEPWRDRAVRAGLLPEDIDVKTADSYMMRMWNKEKLIANRPEANRIFADWIATREADALAAGDDIVPRSKAELESLADEIIDRIVGSPDGRLPYDAARGSGRAGVGDSPRGPLAGRAFLIPDILVRDFIEKDVQHVAETYLRTIVADVLLTEKFGDVDMTEAFRRINEDAGALEKAAASEAERAAIHKQRDATITDLAAMRDRIRHTYGYSSDPRQRLMGRVAATAARYDMITNLGGAALSSLSDLAGIQWRYGFASTFKHAWKPMLKALTDPAQRAALSKTKGQLQALGIAAETYLSTRSAGIYDVIDVYKPATRAERAINVVADKFGLASMLTPWTDFGRFAAGMVSSAETVKASLALAAGTASKRQLRNLAEAGIDAAMASRIAGQLDAIDGSDIVKGIRLPNTASWTDAGARQAFEGAVARDVDLMILTPGAEKPLMMSRPIASLILQYKTFVVAANERLLVRSLQARDHQVLQGLASAIVLGMIAEQAYIIAADREEKDQPQSPADWIKQGMSRSGVLGWYQEANAIASKWTGGTADAYRLMGAGQPDVRYLSRSPLGAVFGPVYGKVENAIKASSKVAAKMSGEEAAWTANDTTQMRRMFAGQNLFYIRRLLDAGEEKVNEWLGVEPKN